MRQLSRLVCFNVLAAEDHGDKLLLDQAKTLKAELMTLNTVCEEGKKMVLFNAWDSTWHAGNVEDWHPIDLALIRTNKNTHDFEHESEKFWVSSLMPLIHDCVHGLLNCPHRRRSQSWLIRPRRGIFLPRSWRMWWVAWLGSRCLERSWKANCSSNPSCWGLDLPFESMHEEHCKQKL